MRPLLTPRWLTGHVIALVAVVGFVFLGMWQLDRHAEKRSVRDAVAASSRLPTLTLAELDEEDTFRSVSVSGTYERGVETLTLRSKDGTSGYHVLSFLNLEDGRILLVDRGWVPLAHIDDPDSSAAPPTGQVTAVGLLWPAEEHRSPLAEVPAVVARIDPQAIGASLGGSVIDSYLVLLDQDPALGPTPEPVEPPTIGLGPHLGYAGQWFLFAGVVVVGYPLLLRRVKRGSAGA